MQRNSCATESLGHLQIVCDGNKEVGYGHFFRCLNLRNALKQQSDALNISWFGAIDHSLVELISDDKYRQYADSKAAVKAVLLAHPCTTLIDSYLLSADDTKQLSEHFSQHLSLNSALIAIDDFAHHPYTHAKAVLNFCVSATDFDYECENQLLGPQYFLNDPRLDEVRQQKLILTSNPDRLEQKASNVLIAMGGFDRFSLGEKLAVSLHEAYPKMNITLLGNVTSTLPSRVSQILRTQDMARLYQQADIVICGGGLIKYESAYCATPSIAVSQTPEQHTESEAFAKKELCLSYGLAQDWHKEAFIEWFNLLNMPRIHAQITAASAEQFFSGSTTRSAKAILDLI